MPPPLVALGMIVALDDSALARRVTVRGRAPAPLQFHLYDLLRKEQALAASAQSDARSEVARILDLVQGSYGELVGLLAGRPDSLLDTTRDGEWTLRDLLRHAIAVELRYAAQVEYSAVRSDREPLAIPDARLPCDRLSPPEPEFAEAKTAGVARVLDLLGRARSGTDDRLTVLPDSALTRPSLWGEVELTVRMRLHQSAAHLIEVVVQSEKCLGPNMDAQVRRIARHCCAIRGRHERWTPSGARAALDVDWEAVAAVC